MTSTKNHYDINPPVTLNPYKHHLRFLREKIFEWQKKDWEDVFREIQLVGNNLTDLYYGSLTIKEIGNQFLKLIREHHIDSPETLMEWLDSGGYQKTVLSDSSIWIIRKGEDPARYLHIHPAKYSPFTIRAKAPALKTVLALNVLRAGLRAPDINEINRIRIEKLSLSPIKTLVNEKGLAKLIHNFNTL